MNTRYAALTLTAVHTQPEVTLPAAGDARLPFDAVTLPAA